MGDGVAWLRQHADSPAVTLFLAAVVLFGAYWRVDVFIVDTVALANGLANLADGSLRLGTVYFGPADLETPGVYVADGRAYARNYGQLVAALPVLGVLKAVSVVAAPRLVLAAVWSGCLAALGGRLARTLDDDRVRLAGLGVATAGFLANVAFGTALSPRLLPLVALQTVTLLAAAGLVATTCLLVALLYDRRAGVAAGVGTLLVGPVGFWATIPKRHVLTAFLVVVTAYLLARSRLTGRRRDRAAAYLPVGLTAWISAPEGLLLLAALAPVDLATSPDNDPRALAGVAAALAVSLSPVLVTNALVSGNPLVPPRALASLRGAGELLVEPAVAPSTPAAGPTGGEAPAAAGTGGGTGGTTGAAGETGDGGGGPSAGALGALVGAVLAVAGELVARVVGTFERGLAALSPSRLYHVFLRSGRIPGVDYAETGGETIDLALLEAAPVLAALAAAPALGAAGRLPSPRLAAVDWTDPRRATDLFAVVFAVVFTVPHLGRLPLHSTVTVRYLLPVVPLLLYGVVRLAPVRRVVREAPGTVVRTALLWTVLLGAAWTAAFGTADVGVGGLMQAHAVVNLAVAAALVAWLVVRPDSHRAGATVLGLAAAAMGLFLLGTGFEYFADGRQFLLPVARLAERAIPILP